MSTTKATRRPKKIQELRKQIDGDPARRARVREHKTAMLSELRRSSTSPRRSSRTGSRSHKRTSRRSSGERPTCGSPRSAAT